jgi:NAD(P)-dependent dehydrogenase (short-subunit alcohol dehydrogenase family)
VTRRMANLSGILSGRHALVTGGGTGIGAAIAKTLLDAGARVTIAGRRREVLKRTAATIGLNATDCITIDVTDAESVAAGITTANASNGAVDILVNNAGRAVSASFLKTGRKALDEMLDINLKGAWQVTEAVLPSMLERRSGRIINIASTAGLVGYAYVTAYAAAKHALIGFTRALALEVSRHGVTVNAVCPGFTETPLLDEAIANITARTGRTDSAARAELVQSNPMGRLVQPQEVADAVVWIASPGSASINGQSIAVCGGEIMTG